MGSPHLSPRSSTASTVANDCPCAAEHVLDRSLSTADQSDPAPWFGTHMGLMCCALLLVVMIFIPSLVRSEVDPHWGWNPQSTGALAVLTAMGPEVVVWLNVAVLCVAAGALWLHVRAGGAIAWPTTCLAFAGIAFAAFHGLNHADNARLCTSWIAACGGGLAVRHLIEHDTPRRFMLACTVALIVPLFVDAVGYVWIEHPMTVANYQQEKTQILAYHGFEEGSVQHRLFEERLGHADAVGAYGLSNVLGSVAATLAAAGIVLGLGAVVSGAVAQGGVALLVGGLGVSTVAMTRSKGAMIALWLSVALSILAVPLARRRPGMVRWLGPCLLLVAVAVVVVRGLIGAPDDTSGERSLLFRAHYWQAAVDMTRHASPFDMFVGRGPAAFARDYPAYKPPLNPEQVASTHSMVVDYLVMLGVGGACWALLLVGWLMRAAQGAVGGLVPACTDPKYAGHRDLEISGPNLGWTVAVAVPLFATQYLFQRPEMDQAASLGWLGSAAGFIVVVAVLRATPLVRRGVQVASFAAAVVVLLLHAQIEMTFFSESASKVAWFVTALAAAPDAAAVRGGRHRIRFLPVGLLGGLALFMAVSVGIPMTRQESRLAAAADALRQQDGREVERLLGEAVAVYPVNPRPYKALVRLAVAGHHFEEALAWIERAEQIGMGGAWCHRIRLQILVSAPSAEPVSMRLRADDVVKALLVASPHNCDTRLRIADALWDLNRRDDAGVHYASALRLHRQTRLDPERQLTESQLTRVTQRLATARGPHGPAP